MPNPTTMKIQGLTLTAVFEAESANYGEGVGNVTTLKKITRGGGASFTYISRQALRYDIVHRMTELSSQDALTPVVYAGTLQFAPDASVADHFEIDLFGYMKTKSNVGASTRSAVARLSNAEALEPFTGDLDFLTNKGLFDRLSQKDKMIPSPDKNDGKETELQGGNIAQSEIHKSFYVYTLTIDLDRVGIDGAIAIANQEKFRRVALLLKALKFLYRDIKGRRENLAPLFAIGGVYDIKNPFFSNTIRLNSHKNLEILPITGALNLDPAIAPNTFIGYVPKTFANDAEILDLSPKPMAISEFFQSLENRVRDYYQEK